MDNTTAALVRAEYRGGSLSHLPTDQRPIWTCHRQHKWQASYEQILQGIWCEECTESLGEMAVRHHLERKNIAYRCEATFPSLVVNGQLRFDFYLPEYRLVIEADGEQHFKKAKFKVKFLDILERDEFKDVWCNENRMSVLRIPYWLISETEHLIDSVLLSIQNIKDETIIYHCSYRDWRTKAIKAIRQRRKAPISPAPLDAQKITKEARDIRRKQRDDYNDNMKLNLSLPMPDFDLRN
jgi:very-short-patch-repair endonuclease